MLISGNREASAQVIFNALGTHSENFNSLPATDSLVWTDNATLPGWYVSPGSTTNYLKSGNGSKQHAGIYSFGTMGTTDRALGGFSAATDLNYGIRIRNNTGVTIKHFTISYTLEQWYSAGGALESVKVFYQSGTNLTSLTGGNWLEATTLAANAPGRGINTVLDGNTNNRYMIETLVNVNLPQGQEIIFRFQDAATDNRKGEAGLGIDDLSILAHNGSTFYAKSSGALNLLSSWTTQPDGKGFSPVSFTYPDQTFRIINNPTPTISAAWTVSGANSRVIVGDGTSAVNFTIPATLTLTGTVDVDNASTLTINNAVAPTLGTLAPRSKVVFANAQTPINPNITYGDITLPAQTTVTLTGNILMNGTLNLNNSRLVLGGYNLIIGPAGSVGEGNSTSYIVTNGPGSLQRTVPANGTSVLFPIGNAASYNPVILSQSAGAVADVFSARVYEGFYSSYLNDEPAGLRHTTNTVDRSWIISEATTGGSNVSLTMFWSSAENLPGFNPDNCQVSHFDKTFWKSTVPKAAGLDKGFYYSTMSNITTFSPFGMEVPTVLPVELMAFDGVQKNNAVRLTWSTAQEKDNDYFLVEASRTGFDFTPVGKIKGQGSTLQKQDYTFDHQPAAAGTIYYRLKQVDFNGEFSYSKIIAVVYEATAVTTFTVYPNPCAGQCFIRGNAAASLSVTDLTGRVVVPQQDVSFSQGAYPLDLSKFPAGIYLLTLTMGDARQVIRIVRY